VDCIGGFGLRVWLGQSLRCSRDSPQASDAVHKPSYSMTKLQTNYQSPKPNYQTNSIKSSTSVPNYQTNSIKSTRKSKIVNKDAISTLERQTIDEQELDKLMMNLNERIRTNDLNESMKEYERTSE
jgi:hypothetical protein